MNSNIQSKTNKRADTSIKLLIETSSIQENIDDIINYIIYNHTTDTMKEHTYKHNDNDNINVEKYQYLKKLYKYTNINYKIYNVNKYINYISEHYI